MLGPPPSAVAIGAKHFGTLRRPLSRHAPTSTALVEFATPPVQELDSRRASTRGGLHRGPRQHGLVAPTFCRGPGLRTHPPLPPTRVTCSVKDREDFDVLRFSEVDYRVGKL